MSSSPSEIANLADPIVQVGAWAYTHSENRWHRVWAVGTTRFSVERCNLDDAHLSACQPKLGIGVYCKWCFAPAKAAAQPSNPEPKRPLRTDLSRGVVASCLFIGGLLVVGTTLVANPIGQSGSPTPISSSAASTSLIPASLSPASESPAVSFLPSPGPSLGPAPTLTPAPTEPPAPSPTLSPPPTPGPTPKPTPAPTPLPSPLPTGTPMPTCFHPGNHVGDPHPCDWPQL